MGNYLMVHVASKLLSYARLVALAYILWVDARQLLSSSKVVQTLSFDS